MFRQASKFADGFWVQLGSQMPRGHSAHSTAANIAAASVSVLSDEQFLRPPSAVGLSKAVTVALSTVHHAAPRVVRIKKNRVPYGQHIQMGHPSSC